MDAELINTNQIKSSRYFSRWDRHLLSFTHELSSPLTAAKINLEGYLLSGDRDGLALLNSNLKLMEDYLNTVRTQIKHQPLKNRLFSVNNQLKEIVRSLSTLAELSNVWLYFEDTKNVRLKGNPTTFKQILACVIKNAIESYDGQKRYKKVTIKIRKQSGFIIIDVADNGNGIKDINHIFSPFYSTKKDASSLGIGLRLAYETIAESFNGYISVGSNELFKTVFSLHFKQK